MVSDEDLKQRRVRFYGVNDLAAGVFVPRVAELAEQFDPAQVLTSAEDAIELHNVQQYLEHGLFPASYSEEDRARVAAQIPLIKSAVARFFSAVKDSNFAAVVAGVAHEYHSDLLELLGRHKAFERCDSETALPALTAAGVHLGEMLASKKLVQIYDSGIRDALLASTRGAEYVVQLFLQDDTRGQIHLPSSLTPTDARLLLETYVDSEEANPNYVGLIATAKENPQAGIDAKLKLRAKRRRAEWNSKFFETNQGIKTGVNVIISETQDEPAALELDQSDGFVSRYSYSRRWLDASTDNPSILNNFVHLFEFVNRHGLLVLPSYPTHLGVMERIMGTTGKTEYKIGAVFRAVDMSTLLQTRLYRSFLESKAIDLERVISWFFEEYLLEEFGASNFSFTPSGPGTSYLEKVRHLFAEMESVVNQFALFAEDGEIDHDLLTMRSDQVRYKDIPSLLEGKYLYQSDSDEISSILYLVFSDQSPLTYINENLNANTAAALLLDNVVTYDDFEDYQKSSVDHLIALGVLDATGTQVRFASAAQFLILKALATTEAASYYHFSAAGRSEADAMVARGWATRRSSLLTDAEGKYFNYYLNAVDFSNGPQLRNKYLHGAQANAEGEDAHFDTYITVLRLLVALLIKINDDFCLAACESSSREGS